MLHLVFLSAYNIVSQKKNNYFYNFFIAHCLKYLFDQHFICKTRILKNQIFIYFVIIFLYTYFWFT
ncbi:hypothetical protein BpHYR1_037977 [Brachionus plicatilis]|uniref:Uncharacterized protein n=1 Tax=Brachionus plicatilis TaxID=10195 RepID=A0A3M7QMB6_BRAPC|nr:hypothetical protein BpHYR1_037977 [Brachionus plicatilis]